MTTSTFADSVLDTADRSTIARLTAAEAAQTRRSVRAYTDRQVDDETLDRLLTLTGRAPSAFNLQPWRFVVTRDPALKAELSAAAMGQKQILAAPVLIALYADMEDTLASLDLILHPGLSPEQKTNTVAMLNRSFGAQTLEQRAAWANGQANIALGYFLLLARAEGLDTSPMLGFDQAKVKTLLGIPEHATVTALVTLGYGAEEGFTSHRHTLDRIVTHR